MSLALRSKASYQQFENTTRNGQGEEGLQVFLQALALGEYTGEYFSQAELYRLKGELTLQQENQNAKGKNRNRSSTPEPQSEAEACFLKAIEVAQQQQAKSLELRATISLARLWEQQDRQHEARTLLFEIYNWFTEGFTTAELRAAKSLLDSLANSPPDQDAELERRVLS